jgi:hypothetical protein
MIGPIIGQLDEPKVELVQYVKIPCKRDRANFYLVLLIRSPTPETELA